MSADLNSGLVKAIANLALFLEFSNPPELGDDAAVAAMEQLAADLQSMSDDAQQKFAAVLQTIASDYHDKERQFLKDFPENFGVGEA